MFDLPQELVNFLVQAITPAAPAPAATPAPAQVSTPSTATPYSRVARPLYHPAFLAQPTAVDPKLATTKPAELVKPVAPTAPVMGTGLGASYFYNLDKAQYDKDLAKYNADLAAYNKAKPDYDKQLTQYNDYTGAVKQYNDAMEDWRNKTTWQPPQQAASSRQFLTSQDYQNYYDALQGVAPTQTPYSPNLTAFTPAPRSASAPAANNLNTQALANTVSNALPYYFKFSEGGVTNPYAPKRRG